ADDLDTDRAGWFVSRGLSRPQRHQERDWRAERACLHGILPGAFVLLVELAREQPSEIAARKSSGRSAGDHGLGLDAVHGPARRRPSGTSDLQRSAWRPEPGLSEHSRESAMNEHVYKTVQITGSSQKSADDAIRLAIEKASLTLKNLRWFEVIETR